MPPSLIYPNMTPLGINKPASIEKEQVSIVYLYYSYANARLCPFQQNFFQLFSVSFFFRFSCSSR